MINNITLVYKLNGKEQQVTIDKRDILVKGDEPTKESINTNCQGAGSISYRKSYTNYHEQSMWG